MLQSIALLAALLLFQPLLAQKEGNIWYFGQSGRGFDFNATSPAVLGNGAMRIHHGEPFTMSDPCGNLLFYSDGQTVWNRDHQIMLNGDGLLRIASTQPVVAVPHPGQDSLYYLFVQAETNSVLPPKAELRYSIIDLRLDKGLGGIAVKNQFLYQTNGSLLTSVRHGNGQDYWIITGEVDANRFLAYRVDQNGLDATPVVNVMPFTFTYSRKLRASPDGHYIAVNAYSGSPEREAWLIGFDNATGKATGTHLLPVKGSGTPVEFSPDGRRMYFSVPGNQMAQLTLDYAGEQTVSSEPVIIKQSQGRNFSDFRLGSDGKLYLGSSYVVDVIDNPNDEAAQLQYRQNAYRVDAFYLPNNLAGYVLGKQTDFPVEPVCGNSPIQFLPRVNYKVRQWQWDFGDPASGEANASTVREPSHRFSGPGSYPVQLITTDYCGDKDTVRKNVILYPDPVIY
jgi:hypothetical protein